MVILNTAVHGCASARGGRSSQSARLSTARCPRVVPRLEEGGGVSLPRCPRLARRLEEGGRVSLPVTVVGTVGSSDRNCGKKYDFDNGSNIHQ